MSYIVFARKYRPQTFSEVVGQDHITQLLEQAITTGRLSQAYLFSGPRGTGKTSCARILAKCLNCETGPTMTPCGKCPSCVEIAKGSSFDVLEMDGASNRGIDEIRNLRENVKFASGYGRYKVYIIDEVHMLTEPAFNALLKTLEEPPEHVKFIFATTEPHKVPDTILSRCQRFDFKRVQLKTITSYLEKVSQAEGLTINQEALYDIAKTAKGGLRDALSILDQLSSLYEKTITSDDVTSMLGLVETDLMFRMVDAIADNNCAEALSLLENIIDKGKDIKQLTKDLTEHFRHLMIVKIGQKSLGKMIDYPASLKDSLLLQSEKFTLKKIINSIDMLLQTQDMARIAESYRMPLEVTFAKLTYVEGAQPAEASVPKSKPVVTENPLSAVKVSISNNRGHVDVAGNSEIKESSSKTPAPKIDSQPKVQSVKQEISVEVPVLSDGALTLSKIKQSWDAVTLELSKKKMSVSTFLQEGIPIELNASTITIAFNPDCLFQKESLEGKDNVKLVGDVFQQILGQPVKMIYKIVEHLERQENDTDIQDALKSFGGEIVGRWHEA